MADQTFERNNGRPHHDTGETGDFLNSLPDREYWAAHGMWYQKPESQDKTFEEYVHESDAERREQARYDEAYAARQGGTNQNARLHSEAQLVRSESPDSEYSDDSLYRNPSPRHDDRGGSLDDHVRRLESPGTDVSILQTERLTIHAVAPRGSENNALEGEILARSLVDPPPESTHQVVASHAPDPYHGDALDDEGLARLLANPPPHMLKEGIRTPVPGALDDDALEGLLAKQREEIYEGGWRNLIQETPSADHLSDEDLERFLVNEREKAFNGNIDAFPHAQHHPDALDDETLANVISHLGFEQRPVLRPQRGHSSRSHAVMSQTRSEISGYGASSSSQGVPAASRPLPSNPRTPPPLISYADPEPGTAETYTTPPSPVRPDGSTHSFDDRLADRRRRMDERQRRQDEAAELEKIREELRVAAAVREGKQPERYYE